jgi:hypothetical protein
MIIRSPDCVQLSPLPSHLGVFPLNDAEYAVEYQLFDEHFLLGLLFQPVRERMPQHIPGEDTEKRGDKGRGNGVPQSFSVFHVAQGGYESQNRSENTQCRRVHAGLREYLSIGGVPDLHGVYLSVQIIAEFLRI